MSVTHVRATMSVTHVRRRSIFRYQITDGVDQAVRLIEKTSLCVMKMTKFLLTMLARMCVL